MPVSLDIGLWTKKWARVDPQLQRDFLLLQFRHSQASSFLDIPLIMMAIITDPRRRRVGAVIDDTATNPEFLPPTRSFEEVTEESIFGLVQRLFALRARELTEEEELEQKLLRLQRRLAEMPQQPMVPPPELSLLSETWALDASVAREQPRRLEQGEDVLLLVAVKVVCLSIGIPHDVDVTDNPYERLPEEEQQRQALRWLARQLLDNILGLGVLKQRFDSNMLSLDDRGAPMTPFAVIMYCLLRGSGLSPPPHFDALLRLEEKQSLVTRAVSYFAFVLFCLWTSPRYRIAELFPGNLTNAGVFTHCHREARPGMMMAYVKPDDDAVAFRRESPPSFFIQVIAHHLTRLVGLYIPSLAHALDCWSSGPLADPHADPLSPGRERMLLHGVRSWFESIFDAPAVTSTLVKGPEAGFSNLLSVEDHALVWRHFIAFGWPCLLKFALQILYEATSEAPLVPALSEQSAMILAADQVARQRRRAGEPVGELIKNTYPSLSRSTYYCGMFQVPPPTQHPSPPVLLEPWLGGIPSDYRDLRELRLLQSSFIIAINGLPGITVDLDMTLRLSEQWDKALLDDIMAGSEEGDKGSAAALKEWQDQFTTVIASKKNLLFSDAMDDD